MKFLLDANLPYSAKEIFSSEDENINLMPASSHHGVIVLRVPDHYVSASIKRVLKEFLNHVDHSELEHALIIVEEGSHRIRKK